MRSKPLGRLIPEINYGDLCIWDCNSLNISNTIVIMRVIFFYVIIGKLECKLDIINDIEESCFKSVVLCQGFAFIIYSNGVKNGHYAFKCIFEP